MLEFSKLNIECLVFSFGSMDNKQDYEREKRIEEEHRKKQENSRCKLPLAKDSFEFHDVSRSNEKGLILIQTKIAIIGKNNISYSQILFFVS